VLEDMCNASEEGDNYTNRYIGTQNQGEQVELYIGNIKELIELIDKYIGIDFKVIKWDNENSFSSQEEKEKGAEETYWNKLMMRKFKNKVLLDENKELNLILNEDYLKFYVEY
jgi:hypothetical protein